MILNHFLIIIIQIGIGLKEELTIIQNDARKIPLDDNSVDFVFIDSPYSDNIKYSDEKQCIGKISCEKTEFYDELGKTASEIARILKPGKAMGLVIADQWIKKKFTAVGFLLWQRLEKYFEPIDIVCLTRHNQTSNTQIWHHRARQFNFYLRGFKDLFIMRKPKQES
ncbi:MAG: methyltransferase domain-containing protein [Deltaproteobacteria bacterium]|nr:methyltransferase domain-containing protein [Deltaproteobacteria bacterium]